MEIAEIYSVSQTAEEQLKYRDELTHIRIES